MSAAMKRNASYPQGTNRALEPQAIACRAGVRFFGFTRFSCQRPPRG
jgi:hypothetical protein